MRCMERKIKFVWKVVADGIAVTDIEFTARMNSHIHVNQ